MGRMSEGVRWLMVPWLLLVLLCWLSWCEEESLVVVFTSDSFKSERVCYIIIIIT